MRKQTLKTLTLAASMIFAAALPAFASESFIVCSGTTFKLTGSYPSGSYAQYEWMDFNGTTVGTTNLSNAADYSNVSLSATTAAVKKQYVTRGHNGSCWSDYDTVTVYVLPALTTTVTAQNSFGCSNDFNDTLTAATDLSGIDWTAIGGQGSIATGTYSWSGGTGTPFGTKDSQYAATSQGTYTASVGYDPASLPTTVNGQTIKGTKVDCTSTGGTTTITTTTAPVAPTVDIQ